MLNLTRITLRISLVMFIVFSVAAEQTRITSSAELSDAIRSASGLTPIEKEKNRIGICDGVLADKQASDSLKKLATEQKAVHIMTLRFANEPVNATEEAKAIESLEEVQKEALPETTVLQKLALKNFLWRGYVDTKQWQKLEQDLKAFPDSVEFSNYYQIYEPELLKGQGKTDAEIGQILLSAGQKEPRVNVANRALIAAGLRFSQMTNDPNLADKALQSFKSRFPNDPFMGKFAERVALVKSQASSKPARSGPASSADIQEVQQFLSARPAQAPPPKPETIARMLNESGSTPRAVAAAMQAYCIDYNHYAMQLYQLTTPVAYLSLPPAPSAPPLNASATAAGCGCGAAMAASKPATSQPAACGCGCSMK